MRLLDTRGRLFGRLNLVDALVVVLVLCVMAAVGWKVFGSAAAANPLNQSTQITYTVRANSIDASIADELRQYVDRAAGKADRLMASGKLLDGYVTGFYAVPHVNYTNDAGGNPIVSAEQGEQARVDLIFTIEATVESSNLNMVGTQEVRIGKTHIVKTVNFEFLYGTVTDCVWQDEEGAA